MTWSCRVAATVLKRRDEILLNSILLFFSNFILYFGIEMMPANWHLVSPYMIPKYQTLKKMFKEENIDLWFFCERWIHVRWNHVDLTHRGKVMMKAKEKTKIIYKIYILTFITYLLDNDRVKFSLSRTINHQNKKKQNSKQPLQKMNDQQNLYTESDFVWCSPVLGATYSLLQRCEFIKYIEKERKSSFFVYLSSMMNVFVPLFSW